MKANTSKKAEVNNKKVMDKKAFAEKAKAELAAKFQAQKDIKAEEKPAEIKEVIPETTPKVEPAKVETKKAESKKVETKKTESKKEEKKQPAKGEEKHAPAVIDETKEAPKPLEWKEKLSILHMGQATTREGLSLSIQNMEQKMIRTSERMANWPLQVMGYDYLPKGIKGNKDGYQSNYSTLFGRSWKEGETLINAVKRDGEIIILSAGSRANHALIILPAEGKTLTLHNSKGEAVRITRDNFHEYAFYSTNHGRLHKIARILADTYKLNFIDIFPSTIGAKTYERSNASCWTFTKGEGDTWQILNAHGIGRTCTHPAEVLGDYIKTGKHQF
jgi:hypothetical protein